MPKIPRALEGLHRALARNPQHATAAEWKPAASRLIEGIDKRMIRIATAPVSPSRSYQCDSLGRPTSRTLARQGATRNDAFTYNDRSESPRRLVGGLYKTADGVRRVSLWCSHCPAKQGEGTMGCARSKPRSAFAPQGRAGNGVPASQFYDLTTFVQKN